MKIHLEWGLQGARQSGDVAIIVDVLSFSSAVSVGCRKGARIYPFPLRDEARQFAGALGIVRAGKRGAGGLSLAPRSLQDLAGDDQLVLPSPNGATLTLHAQADMVLAGCLRNASAVADYVRMLGCERVVLVAAGERWRSDGTLRPAFEDLLGCGAIARLLGGVLSPEAQASVDVFDGVQDDLLGALLGCQSGIELSGAGYRDDVVWASDLDAERVVPRLWESDEAYPFLSGEENAGLERRKILFYQAPR